MHLSPLYKQGGKKSQSSSQLGFQSPLTQLHVLAPPQKFPLSFILSLKPALLLHPTLLN